MSFHLYIFRLIPRSRGVGSRGVEFFFHLNTVGTQLILLVSGVE